MSPDRILPGSAGQPDPTPEGEPVAPTTNDADEQLAVPGDETVASPVDRGVALDGARDGVDPIGEVPAAIAVDDDGDEPLTADVIPPGQARHGRFGRLYYGETRIDFVRRKRTWFLISTVIILAGAISLGVRGLNFSIDFDGGTSWIVPSKTLTIAETNTAIGGSLANPTVTVLGVSGSSNRTVEVEAKLPKGQTAAEQQVIADKVSAELATVSGEPVNNIAVESVGPSWGSQITNKAVEALIVFFILIAIYISIFFEWRMAVAAIAAVLHDILVTVGIYSLSGFQVTPDTVVAFLTILGYSLYDTIVVFDRVRDNTRHLTVRDRITFSDVVNLSMNQTLARSINTSAVAIMPILAMLILGAEILGASTLQYFGLALLVGLATGAYSSIFIASPLVAIMKEREQKYRIIRERVVARGGDRLVLSAAAVARGAFGDSIEARGGSAGQASGSRSSSPAKRPTPAKRAGTQRRPPSSRSKPKGGRR